MNKAMNIGQRVQNAYGEVGTIIDRMYSEAEQEYYYSVKLDSRSEDEGGQLYLGDEIKVFVIQQKEEYSVETEILKDICLARVYKVVDGVKKEISRGHGHRIHEGEVGILQALSYAFKKAYEKINENQIGGKNNGIQ